MVAIIGIFNDRSKGSVYGSALYQQRLGHTKASGPHFRLEASLIFVPERAQGCGFRQILHAIHRQPAVDQWLRQALAHHSSSWV